VHGRAGVERALVIGLMDCGTRFIAETPSDEQTLQQMMSGEMIGVSGVVTGGEEKNLFVPDFA
jgi:acetyl-CoA C-acetyltransferase